MLCPTCLRDHIVEIDSLETHWISDCIRCDTTIGLFRHSNRDPWTAYLVDRLVSDPPLDPVTEVSTKPKSESPPPTPVKRRKRKAPAATYHKHRHVVPYMKPIGHTRILTSQKAFARITRDYYGSNAGMF